MERQTGGGVWIIVLAAGDGIGLGPLVRVLHDDERPRQFAIIIGGRSLLQQTVERARAIAPPERTVVVVPEAHEALARQQLAPYRTRVAVQPSNRGSAVGFLLGLSHVLASDELAQVVVFPSEHYIPRARPFLDAVRRAAAVASNRIALLGIAPGRAETRCGWIVPGRDLGGGLRAIKRFVDRPPQAVARTLFQECALWNAMVLAGMAGFLWEQAQRHLPEHAQSFARYVTALRESAHGADLLRQIHLAVRPADLGRSLLERGDGHAVVKVEGSGWSDWRSPDRVLASLEGTPYLHPLLRRIFAAQKNQPCVSVGAGPARDRPHQIG